MSVNPPEQSALSVTAAPAQPLRGRPLPAFEPEPADSQRARGASGGADLRRLVARGVLWMGAGTIARQVLQLASGLILARLLAPDLFGIVAMALVFVGIGEIFVDFGLRQAIIQTPQPTGILLSSCFWLSAGIGIVAALVLCVLAPVIAALYQEPRITPLLPFLGLNLFVATLSTVPRALLQREMNFGVLTRLTFVAGLIAVTTGCTMAALGGGVWSLIVQPLMSSFVGTILIFATCRWRPGFEFSAAGLHGLIRFSGGVLGAALLNYLNRNADNFLIGRFLGAVALGYYNIAYQMMLLPLAYVSSNIGAVAYPALVRLQDDLDRYKRVYLRTCSVIAFVSFPMMSGLFVVADQFVPVVLGSKWLPATTVLKILCPLGMVQSIATTVGLIYTSTGRTKTLFLWNVGATPVIVLSFVVGLPWGIEGVAASLRCGNDRLDLPVIPNCLRDHRFADPFPVVRAVALAGLRGGHGRGGVSAGPNGLVRHGFRPAAPGCERAVRRGDLSAAFD